jgi:hypothetical protein
LTESATLSIIDTSKIDKEMIVARTSRPGRRLSGIRAFLSLLLTLDVLAVAAAVVTVLTGNNATSLELPRDAAFGAQAPLLATSRAHLSGVAATISEPSAYLLILDLLAHSLAFTLAAIPMIVLAQRLIDRAADTHPFTAEMVTGLRGLGRLILGAGLLALIASNVAAVLLFRSVVPDSGAYLGANLVTDLWWLPLGLVVLAFAQVIEHGHSLRTELDEVV